MRAIMVALTIAMASSTALAARVAITVEANPTKANHQPWDGLGDIMLGPIITGAQGPPDLVACIFSLEGSPACLYGPRGPRSSRCHDSLDCDWDGVEVPAGIYGIVILDLDVSQDDFVDAVILLESSKQKREPQIQLLEDDMRAYIARHAPAASPAEQARRDRPFQRIPAELCEESCTLRQSKILLIPEN